MPDDLRQAVADAEQHLAKVRRVHAERIAAARTAEREARTEYDRHRVPSENTSPASAAAAKAAWQQAADWVRTLDQQQARELGVAMRNLANAKDRARSAGVRDVQQASEPASADQVQGQPPTDDSATAIVAERKPDSPERVHVQPPVRRKRTGRSADTTINVQPVDDRKPWERTYLATLATTGNLTAAAEAAGIDRSTALRHRHASQRFAERVADALARFSDAVESEIARRGMQGFDEPVYQGGKKVGVKRRYSDRCLLALAARLRPDGYGAQAVKLSGDIHHHHDRHAADAIRAQVQQLFTADADQLEAHLDQWVKTLPGQQFAAGEGSDDVQ